MLLRLCGVTLVLDPYRQLWALFAVSMVVAAVVTIVRSFDSEQPRIFKIVAGYAVLSTIFLGSVCALAMLFAP